MEDQDKLQDELQEEINGEDLEEQQEEKAHRERICYICRRPESKAGPMLDMPGGMYMCHDCMQKAFDTISRSNIDLSRFPAMPLFRMDSGTMPGQAQEGTKKQKTRKRQEKPVLTMKDIPAPHQIKAKLDEYVIGQEKAKKAICVAVYNHYKRAFLGGDQEDADGVVIQKSNILMIGPTGSGKTYLVKTLAKLLDVPLAIADATSLTEAGYIGDDIESVVSKLLAAADNDVERAEHGIIFIDEIDKIAKKKQTTTRDVSGESVQQELLKLLEGSVVEVPIGSNQKNAMTPTASVNTDDILFICGGAVTLQGVDQEMLVRILKEPKNAIVRQYEKLLAMDEVKLVFEDDALEWIAAEALKRGTGARALRAVMEELMLDIMYEIHKDPNIGSVVVTRPYLEKNGGPLIQMRG